MKILNSANETVYDETVTDRKATFSASDYWSGTFKLYVYALDASSSTIASASLSFKLTDVEPEESEEPDPSPSPSPSDSPFPHGGGGGGRRGGGGGGGQGGGTAFDSGITAGSSFAEDHSKGSKDLTVYGTVSLTCSDEEMTVLTLGDTQLDITLDDAASSFKASLEEQTLTLTATVEGKEWRINLGDLETLNKSGAQTLELVFADTVCQTLQTDFELSGYLYGTLRSQGLVASDLWLVVTPDALCLETENALFTVTAEHTLERQVQ